MRNEIVSSQIFKKRQVFTVKEKIRRRKSKTLTSPVTRQRRNTEPINLTYLGKLKKQLRLSQESMSYPSNQVPPYTQPQRQRATSIPSSYQFQNVNQNSYSYINSMSLDQVNNSQGQNTGYSPYHQQTLSSNQSNISKNIPNQNGNQQNSYNKTNSNSSNNIITPSSKSSTIQNSGNQREIQQTKQPHLNTSSQGMNGQNKNYSNVPVSSQTMSQQPSSNVHQQFGNEITSAKGNNNYNSTYKQNHSSTNSINSISTNPYSTSSQTDFSINHPSVPYYAQDKSHALQSSAPTIQKSNSWVGGEQNHSQSYNLFNEPPPFHQTQQRAPQYGNDYNNQFDGYYPPNREYSNSLNYPTYSNKNVKGGYGNNSNSISYFPNNIENQQFQSTPSTNASRKSHSPHNGGVVESFDHSQNLFHSQSEQIEQEFQDLALSNKANEYDKQEQNYYKDSLQFISNQGYDENELPNIINYPDNNYNYEDNNEQYIYQQNTDYY